MNNFRTQIMLTPDHIDALSRIVDAEAGNQSSVGKQAVLFNVLNRTAATTGGFPNDPIAVIEQRNQYEPMIGKSSFRDLAPARPETQALVLQTLQGFASGNVTDPTNGATFFQNTAITNKRGTNFASAAPVAEIEDHSFYNRYKLNPVVEVPSYTIALSNGVDLSQSALAQPNDGVSNNYAPDAVASASLKMGASPMSDPRFQGAYGSGYLSMANAILSGQQQASPAPQQAAPRQEASSQQIPMATPISYQPPETAREQSKYGLKPAHDGVDLSGLDPATIEAARYAAALYGGDFTVTSGYRSQAKQDAIRARGNPNRPTVAKHSHHTSGTGFDMAKADTIEGQIRQIDALARAGFTGFGVYNGHIHADRRDVVASSFGKRDNWLGWTNADPKIVAHLKSIGFQAGKPSPFSQGQYKKQQPQQRPSPARQQSFSTAMFAPRNRGLPSV